MSDHGVISLPDDHEIPWVRRTVTPEELSHVQEELEGRWARVLMQHDEYGQQLLTEYVVPQRWLCAFLLEWLDEVGTGTEQIISVEAIPTITVDDCG